MFGDVNIEVEDGLLGISGTSGIGIHVKIGASPVVSNAPIGITGTMNATKIKEKLGLSPLADACMDSIENGANRIYCIPVMPSIEGKVGNISKTGEGKGNLVITGKPYNKYNIIIKVTGKGGFNTAAIRYSVNGGYSFEDEVTIPLDGELDLLNTGLIIKFNEDSTDKESSFEIDDTYQCTTEAPQMTNSDVLSAVERLINFNYSFEFVHIVGESSKSLWAALAIEARKFLETYKKPLFFVLEARYILDSETLEEYVDNMLTLRKGIESKYIQVCIAYSNYVRSDGSTGIINNAGIVCGLYGTARISQSIGEVKSFGISTGKMIELLPEGIEDFVKDLDEAKYLTFRKYEGRDNFYVSNAKMMSSELSDYRYAEDIRVSNKLIKVVRTKALEELQTEIDMEDIETSLTALEKILSEPVETMASDKEISSGTVKIDIENQNILVDESIDVTIRYVPIGHIREINLKFGMENPYK